MASYFEKGRGYRYDFRLFGERHRGPAFTTKRDSDEAERALRRELKLERAGVVVLPRRRDSPRFANWAGTYSEHVHDRHARGELKRPEIIDANLSSVLRFWGVRPTEPDAYVHPTAPYHDLTLADPIEDPTWLLKWDQWMTAEGIAGQTRNHYNTTMRRMFWLALQPEYRKIACEPRYNPFADRPRSKWKRRTATLSADEIRAWISHASYHARLALSIATLNPKFRLTNILKLEWADVDVENRLITVWDHKTDDSGLALVAWMPTQLLNILKDSRLRHPRAERVILYRHEPVKSIDYAVKSAAIAAGLTWGRDVAGGVTFHSIRHSISTLLARKGVSAERRMPVTGHADLDMELWYTHLVPNQDEREHAELLSTAVPIETEVTHVRTRAPRRKNTKALGGLSRAGGKSGELSIANGVKSGRSGPLRGLRQGPQLPASRRAK